MALLALLWNHLKPFETIWNHKSATFPKEIFTWSYRKATGSTKSDLRTSIRIRGSLDHLVLRHLRRSHPGKAGFFYPPEDPGGHWVCFLVSSIWYLMEAPPFDFFELSDGFWYDQPNFSRGCKDRGIQRHSFSGQKCVDYIGPMPQQRYQHGAVIPKGPRMVYAWMFLSPFFCLKQIKKTCPKRFFMNGAKTGTQAYLRAPFCKGVHQRVDTDGTPSETTAAHPSPLRLSLAFLMPITFRTMAGFKIAWSRAQNPLNHSTQHCVYDSSANGLPGNVISGNMFSASLWFSLQFADHN